MTDDFNTAEAIGSLFDLVKAMNRSIDSHGWTKTIEISLNEIKELGSVLGIIELDPDDYLKTEKLSKKTSEITEDELNRLIEERDKAREGKNWEKADQIRSYLISKSIILEDKATGTIWRIKN